MSLFHFLVVKLDKFGDSVHNVFLRAKVWIEFIRCWLFSYSSKTLHNRNISIFQFTIEVNTLLNQLERPLFVFFLLDKVPNIIRIQVITLILPHWVNKTWIISSSRWEEWHPNSINTCCHTHIRIILEIFWWFCNSLKNIIINWNLAKKLLD